MPTEGADTSESYAFPLSAEQERIWQADRLCPGNSAYNAAFRWELCGPLNPRILEQTFNEIVRRHESLRTTFATANGSPIQIVASSLRLRVAVTDLRATQKSSRESEIERMCAEEAIRGFDIETGPLIRVGLLQIEEERYIMMITAHHIICDGWSIRLMMEEMQQIYPAFAVGRESPLPENAIQYGDFVLWQRERIQSGDFSAQTTYWKEKLAGCRPLQVPTDFLAPAKRTTSSAITALQMPLGLTDRLKQFSNDQGGTMFSTTLAACMALLHGYVGETDIAIGSPVAGRARAETEGLIGLLLNHVVFRVQAADDPQFPEFARLVRDAVWEAMANQDIPFAHVLEALKDCGAPCPDPLYTINFVCHQAFGGTSSFVFEFCGIRVSTIPSKSQGALYDLNFFLIERETGWRLSLEYNTDLYSEVSARRMLENFSKLLEAIATDPNRRLTELLTLADIPLANRVWPNIAAKSTAAEADIDDKSIDHLERNAQESADAYIMPASVTQERFWLLTKIAPDRSAYNMPAAVRIAGPLSQQILSRSFRFLVDRHEILRTTFKEVGGRLVQHIAAEGHFSLQLSDLDGLPKEEPDKQLRELLLAEARSSFDLEHGPLFRARLFRLQADEHVLIVTLHHIISDGWSQGILQRELWSAYAAFEQGLSPSLAPLEIQYADFSSWQNEWLASGQALEHLDFWRKQLVGPLPMLSISTRPAGDNPTSRDGAIETLRLPDGLLQTLKRLSEVEKATTFMLTLAGFAILLGRYCTDEDVIVGSPVANRRSETEPLIGPFSTPIALRLDLSGDVTLRDILRRVSQVTLDALDHSELPFEVLFDRLKIRSVQGRSPLFQFYFVYQTAFLQPRQLPRLSVTPLSAQSVGTPFELQLAVIERFDGVYANLEYDPRRFDGVMIQDMLRYYQYVLQEFASNPDQLITNLDVPTGRQSGPRMVASADRRAEHVAPRDALETRLVAIWKEIFDLPNIGIRDDFFEIGGQSIMAARMISQIEKEFGKRIDLSTLLVDRTIEKISDQLRSTPTQDTYSHVVPLRPTGKRPPLFCIHGGGGHLLDYGDLVAALSEDQPVFGLRASDVKEFYQPETVEQLAEKYLFDMQRIQAHGPYQICGLSFGGLVAYAIATKLAERGESVGVVALFDTGNWAYYRNLPPARMQRFRRAYLADRFARYGRNLRQGRLDEFFADARMFISSKLKFIIWNAGRTAARVLNRPIPGFARSNIQIFSSAGRDYIPRPYPGRMILFRAEGRTAEYGDDETLGWSGVPQGGVVVHRIPGGHLTIMRKPQVHCLVERLELYLADTANRRG